MRQADAVVSPAAWVAAFRPENRAAGPERHAVELLQAPAGWSPSVAEIGSCRVVFDGLLHNRSELRTRFAGALPDDPGDAGLVGHAYQSWGEEAIRRLKGAFTLLVSDRARGVLLCARDPVGIHPLYYVEARDRLLLSPSIEALLECPGVSREIDRTYLVDRLTRRWLDREGTSFASVRRVPPGHIMLVGGASRRVFRYWDPLPSGRSLEWIPDEEVRERFPLLLEQAVGRCLSSGPAGIFLSGGLDSSAVAMTAADVCRREGRALPWALSLEYPDVSHDEATVPRGLPAALGLAHLQLPVDEAAGPEGTLAAALTLTRTLPVPVSTMWRQAFMGLALRGRKRGCRVILTGDGADEGLWENPILAADYLRSGDLRGLYRLWRSYAHSYRFSHRQMLRLLGWRSGARPLLRDACHAAAVGAGIGRLVPRRWSVPPSIALEPAPWIAPDPALRTEVRRRLEERYPASGGAPRNETYYAWDTRRSLEAPEKWLRFEEGFLLWRRSGVFVRHPFWDSDLIELMVRIPPHLRSEEGRAKALVRRPLARRFPRLGFDGQRKSVLGHVLLETVAGQGGKAREAMGGVRALAELGVVDTERVTALLDDALSGREPRWTLMMVWEILNLEAWARAHS